MQRGLTKAGVFLSIAVGMLITAQALADDLPNDAVKRIHIMEDIHIMKDIKPNLPDAQSRRKPADWPELARWEYALGLFVVSFVGGLLYGRFGGSS
jgi:hypothetical protein